MCQVCKEVVIKQVQPLIMRDFKLRKDLIGKQRDKQERIQSTFTYIIKQSKNQHCNSLPRFSKNMEYTPEEDNPWTRVSLGDNASFAPSMNLTWSQFTGSTKR